MSLCVFTSLSSLQIVCSLEQDDGARKQRLAFKLEQVVAFMSLESWGPHFPGRTGKRPHQKPSRAWAKTCPHLFSSCDFLPPPFKDDDFFLDLFFCFLFPEKYFLFSSSTLLHRLVYQKISEGWFGAEVGVSHSAMRGIPQLHHRESVKGWLLESWPYWHTSVPLLEEKRGKTFLCCLQEFTLIGNSLKTTMLGVHFVENFFQK